MIHSMTGYAVAQAVVGASTLGIELRSVNSRYLEIQFRITEELRVLEPALRVLYMSGYTQQTTAQDAGIGRGLPFVQKPFTAADLVLHVRDAMGR